MSSDAGGSDSCRRRDLFPLYNRVYSNLSFYFFFYKSLEPFESYLLGLTFEETTFTGDREKRGFPATLILPHSLRTGSTPQTAKKGLLILNQAIEIRLPLTIHPRSTRSKILPDRSHKNNHQYPEKDMAKPPFEPSSIISEQASTPPPICRIDPPPSPPLRRRRLDNDKTLITMMGSSSMLGLILFGLLVFQPRPTNGIFGPTILHNCPRYNNLILLSRLRLLRSLYFVLRTRRHPPYLALTSKIWSCDWQYLILLINASWPSSFEHVFLRTLDPLSPPTSRRYDCDCKSSPKESTHRISLMTGLYLGSSLASCPVRVSRTHGSSLLLGKISFVEKSLRIVSPMCNLDLLSRAPKQSISDYESLPHLYTSLIVKPYVKSFSLMEKLSNPPSSYMERTPSSYMERTLFTSYRPRLLAPKQTEHSPFLTFVLLCVELFASTKIKVLESSSTSPCQSTMTIISPPELFVEVSPTCHEFSWANLLSSFYTQVFTDHKLDYFIYLNVALANAFSFHIVNFGISKSLLSLYFGLVCFL